MRLQLLMHAITQLLIIMLSLRTNLVSAEEIQSIAVGRIEAEHVDCRDSLLSWLRYAGVSSFLQPSASDVDVCLARQDQYCFIKKRLPIQMTGSPLPTKVGTPKSELSVVFASLSTGACLSPSCTPDSITHILDSMCTVRSCTSLSSQAEISLCTLTQALHCDPDRRLNIPSNSAESIYLHCAANDLPVSNSRANLTNFLSLAPIEAKALTACGTEYLRDPRLFLQSGFLQDLGDYDGCSAAHSNSNYCLVEYYGVLAAGRCVPRVCTESLMLELFSFMCKGIGKNGMAFGVESTCLDFANVIPLDLCISAQLLGCGRAFRLADMSSGEIDVDLIAKLLFHPHKQSASHNPLDHNAYNHRDTFVYKTSDGVKMKEAERFGPPVHSSEYLKMAMNEVEDTLAQITQDVASFIDYRYGRNLLADTKDPENAISYAISCDLKPVPKQGRDWIISWILLGSFFLILPLVGCLAYRESSDSFIAGATPTPISNTAVVVPQLSLFQRIQLAIGAVPWLNSFLLCFSVPSNVAKALLNRQRIRHGPFPHLDGLRSLSIVWIVVGHAFIFGMRPGVLHNLGGLSKIWDSFTFQAVYSAQFAVDTFFLISGMMLGVYGPSKVAQMIIRDQHSSRTIKYIKIWFQLVLQRFVRLAGLYYFVMAISYYTLQFCGISPKWPSLIRLLRTGEEGGCQKYWWSLALFINNIYPDEALTECFGHAWYLANDFQFFLIGAILIILICSKEFWFRILWWLTLCASLACTWSTIMTYNIRLPATLLSGMEPTVINGQKSLAAGLIASFTKFYSKPWCRIPPYLLGIYYGKLYRSGVIADLLDVQSQAVEANGSANGPSEQYVQLGSPRIIGRRDTEKIKGDSVLATMTNLTVIIVLLFLIFIPYEANRADAPEWNRIFDASYMAFSRTIWALALGWLICGISYCSSDHAKKEGSATLQDPFTHLIFNFLSQPIFSFIGLVSYALYLIHLPIQEVYYASLRTAISLTEGSGWFNGICFAGISLIAAVLLHIFVELPLAGLARRIGL